MNNLLKKLNAISEQKVKISVEDATVILKKSIRARESKITLSKRKKLLPDTQNAKI